MANKVYTPPQIYLSPDLPDQPRLAEICKRHQGQVVGSESLATHIIVPTDDIRQEDRAGEDGREGVRDSVLSRFW